MKRKTVFFIVLAVIVITLIIIRILMFSPKRIVNKSDYIVGLVVKYHDSEVPAVQNDIIEILSKYNAVTSLNSFSPYENDKVDFEIYYVDNNKPVHILLGEFNLWYESADGFAHDILDAGQLKNELMDALNLK
jgi:hypothetical protein